MAQKTFDARVKWKRDTSANWTSNDPVLLNGEIIIVDTSSGETRFKIGDGIKKYSQLPFEDEAVRNLISSKVDKVDGKGLSTNDYTDAEKSKLAGIAEGANKYVHPTTTGNKHIPSGGSNGQILRWVADGTAEWGGAGGIVYSTEETDTGNIWLDGKPIYKKMITFSAPANANASTTISYDYSGMDVIWIDASSSFFVAFDNTTTINHMGYVSSDGARLFMVQPRPERSQLLIVTNNAGVAYIYLCYTKTSDLPTYYHLPFLGSNNDQGCVVTTSSEYSTSYVGYYAFNGNTTGNYWACKDTDVERWIQVQMPYKIKNAKVTLVSPSSSSSVVANVPVSGSFIGANNNEWFSEIGTFDNRPALAGSVTKHTLGNSTGYNCLRIQVAQPTGIWTGFGDIRIEGEVDFE